MAPDCAKLLATGRQPGLLAKLDMVFRVQNVAAGSSDLLRDGRCLQVDFATDPTEGGERKNTNDS
jgi:hypothetical protein